MANACDGSDPTGAEWRFVKRALLLTGLAAPVVFLGMVLVVFYPMSFAPSRYALSHRTASSHAVEMFHLGAYLGDGGGGNRFERLDLWGYPEGGEAKPLGVPALLAGWPLAHALSPRTAFNLVFMGGLWLSAYAFYSLARFLRFSIPAAIVVGAAPVFHPCVASFVLRGQIENTLLWTAAVFLWCSCRFLAEGRARDWAGAFVLMPIVMVFSTPYYAIFAFMLALPVVFLCRARLKTAPSAKRWMVWGSGMVVALVVTGVCVAYYAPAADGVAGADNLNAGTQDLGLAAAPPLDSLSELFDPGKLLWEEKPYVGLSLLLPALISLAVVLWGSRGRERMASWVLSISMLGFLVLAAGRAVGETSLPAAWVDALLPAFQNVIKLFRILPFAAACGALVIGLALTEKGGRLQWTVVTAWCLLLVVEGMVVSPPWERPHAEFYLDARRDIGSVVEQLPSFADEDLPVLDLPGNLGRRRKLWNPFTYWQTEHLQRLVWFDGEAAAPSPVRAALQRWADDPTCLTAEQVAHWLNESGVGLVVLHKGFVSEADVVIYKSVLDSIAVRLGENEQTVAWRVEAG